MLLPCALHAQGLPAGVALGMTASDLTRLVPQLERVRHPPRMSGGLVGTWRSKRIQMFGMIGQQTYYFADDQLRRVEFVGAVEDAESDAEVFDRLIGKSRKAGQAGIEIAAKGKHLATLRPGPKGRAVSEFEAGVLPVARQDELAKLIRDFLTA